MAENASKVRIWSDNDEVRDALIEDIKAEWMDQAMNLCQRGAEAISAADRWDTIANLPDNVYRDIFAEARDAALANAFEQGDTLLSLNEIFDIWMTPEMIEEHIDNADVEVGQEVSARIDEYLNDEMSILDSIDLNGFVPMVSDRASSSGSWDELPLVKPLLSRHAPTSIYDAGELIEQIALQQSGKYISSYPVTTDIYALKDHPASIFYDVPDGSGCGGLTTYEIRLVPKELLQDTYDNQVWNAQGFTTDEWKRLEAASFPIGKAIIEVYSGGSDPGDRVMSLEAKSAEIYDACRNDVLTEHESERYEQHDTIWCKYH